MRASVGVSVREGVTVLSALHNSPAGWLRGDFAIRLEANASDADTGAALLTCEAESTLISREDATALARDPAVRQRYRALFNVQSQRSMAEGMRLIFADFFDDTVRFTPWAGDNLGVGFAPMWEVAFIVTDLSPVNLGAQVRVAVALTHDPMAPPGSVRHSSRWSLVPEELGSRPPQDEASRVARWKNRRTSVMVKVACSETHIVVSATHLSSTGIIYQGDFWIRTDASVSEFDLGEAIRACLARSIPLPDEDIRILRDDKAGRKRYLAQLGVRSERALAAHTRMVSISFDTDGAKYQPMRPHGKNGAFEPVKDAVVVVTDLSPANLGAQVRVALALTPDPIGSA